MNTKPGVAGGVVGAWKRALTYLEGLEGVHSDASAALATVEAMAEALTNLRACCTRMDAECVGYEPLAEETYQAAMEAANNTLAAFHGSGPATGGGIPPHDSDDAVAWLDFVNGNSLEVVAQALASDAATPAGGGDALASLKQARVALGQNATFSADIALARTAIAEAIRYLAGEMVADDLVERLQHTLHDLGEHRQTHVVWRDWLLKDPANAKVNPNAGTAEFHDNTIRDYDRHLANIGDAIRRLASAPARVGEGSEGPLGELADDLAMFATQIREHARGEGSLPNPWQIDDWMARYRAAAPTQQNGSAQP